MRRREDATSNLKAESVSVSTKEMGNGAAIGGGTRWTRRSVLGAVCALVIGLYAWMASPGYMELLGSGARDSFYNLLVRGFRDGQLNVKQVMPPGVVQLDNSDWVFLHGLSELSYYKGRLYLYYGVTPALLLFWPYAALTGHYMSHLAAVVILLSVGFLAGAGLLRAVWRRCFRETGFGVVVAGTLALALSNFAPTLLGRCDVYEVAVSCGFALTMLALAGVWGALQDARRRPLWLAAASLACGLAVGARPSLLFGALILLVPVAQAWREKRPVRPLLLAAGGPIVLIGLGLMFYNALRFDNPLEFGQRYQLPFATHHQFSPRYLWFNFRVMFLEPARWSGSFPFVHDISPPAMPQGYNDVEHPFGVLTNVPIVWLALAAPLAWRSRSGEDRSLLRGFFGAVALLFGMCALPLCLHDSVCVRYELEYASPLLLLAVMGAFALERALAGQSVWRVAVRCGWVLLLAFSAAFNLFLGFGYQAGLQCGYGAALLQMGSADEAVSHFQKALQIKPDYAEARLNLDAAFALKANPGAAAAQIQKALEINPDQPALLNNLAWLLAATPDASLRNGAKALALAKQADQFSGGGNPAILRTLAAAYAETGGYPTASVTARRALGLAQGRRNKALAAALQKEIKLYEAGVPVRNSPP